MPHKRSDGWLMGSGRPQARVIPIRDTEARALVRDLLDDALAERDLAERMQMATALALEARNSTAMRRALEEEAVGPGRLRRRAVALFALGEEAGRALSRLPDRDLVSMVLTRQLIAWEKTVYEADGLSRISRNGFAQRDREQQITLIEALTESEEELLPGTAAFMAWLADHSKHRQIRQDAAAILAEEEDRDWLHEAIVAIQSLSLEQAARAYELAGRGSPQGAFCLERGLSLCAAADWGEAADAFEEFLALDRPYPLRAAIQATLPWLRERERAMASGDEDDQGSGGPFPLPLPFLMDDPVAAVIERRALTPSDAAVQRATWGLALVAIGEDLAEFAWDAEAWAQALGWLVEHIRQGQGEERPITPSAVRGLTPDLRRRVEALAACLRLDRATWWLEGMWAALLHAQEAEDAEVYEADGDSMAPGATAEALGPAFLASLPTDGRTADRMLVLDLAGQAWADLEPRFAKVDDIALWQALAECAVAKGMAAVDTDLDTDAFIRIALDTLIRLASFLAETWGAPADAANFERHTDDLVALMGRLIGANAAAGEEAAASDDPRNVHDDLSEPTFFAVEAVPPGRIRVRHVDSGRLVTIVAHAGLDRHLAAGDLIVGAVAKAPKGRHVLIDVEGVRALPGFLLAKTLPR